MMKGFFDTSVLVPMFYADHAFHRLSLDLLRPIRQILRLLRRAHAGGGIFHTDTNARQTSN